MKKTFLLSVLITFISVCHSQSRFGIFAGPQTTTARYSVTGIKQPAEYKFGFHAGFGWKILFENHLFFSPAAFYSFKGYKVKFNRYAFPPDTAATNNNTSIHTFELAFLLQFDLGNKPSHFFIKAGPSLDFQLTGKEKFNLKTGGTVNRNMNYDYTAYGHYSANMIMQLGFEIGKGFMIFGQYTLGLTNLNNADAGPNIRHRAYGISLGKYFNNKKIVSDTQNKASPAH
jgi:hypothetical protein